MLIPYFFIIKYWYYLFLIAAWAAANRNRFSALYGKFGKHLGNIMSMYSHYAPYLLKISDHFCHFDYFSIL